MATDHDHLRSDHVNYLIFRYLQESGFANAARGLASDWHRPQRYHDPENFPFAVSVEQDQLVSLIQDALFLDRLQATKRGTERRYKLLTSHQAVETAQETDVAGSGRADPGKATGTDGQLPKAAAPKRARKRALSSTHPIGDAMEIDGAESEMPPPPARAQDEARSQSAETEHAPSSLGTATETPQKDFPTAAAQTENPSVISLPVPVPRYLSLEESASVLRLQWSPHPSPSHPSSSMLLATGENLCRILEIPSLSGDVTESQPLAGAIKSSNVTSLPDRCSVTATHWNAELNRLSVALAGSRSISTLSPHMAGELDTSVFQIHGIDLNHQSSQPARVRATLEVPALAFVQSPHGSRCLALTCGAGGRGCVRVWDDNWHRLDPDFCAVRHFPSVLLNAVWLDENRIATVGQGIIAIVAVRKPEDGEIGLPVSLETMQTFESSDTWEEVLFEPCSELLVARSASGALRFAKPSLEEVLPDELRVQDVVTMALFTRAQAAFSRLAVSYEDGSISVLRLRTPDDLLVHRRYEMNVAPIPLQIPPGLEPETARCLAWSPGGDLLAAGTWDSIKVWRVDTVGAQPIATWNADHSVWRLNDSDGRTDVDSGLGSEDVDGEADKMIDFGEGSRASAICIDKSLSWDASGTRLALGVGRNIAIVRWRPVGEAGSVLEGDGLR
ncbi:hypothetical protein LTR66_009790 [Elasticomyces elasticus]|nr:hypothetical protein LTR66_009790 [Elasticomyces elasticus]KAK4988168.1 hypothetical protein LTR50_004091 [Elasticomyces elasticus]